MARRTQVFQQIPWTGGLNSSVDPGVLPPNDLVICDNVVNSTAGSRLKREGLSYIDSAVPATTYRSSSGTDRTLVFASSVSIAAPANQILCVGEKITVAGAGNSIYNCTGGTISAISTTTTTNDTITYTFVGATSVAEGSTADTAAVVTKYSNVLGVFDFWYYSSSNQVKEQLTIGITDQPKIFKYDSAGRRVELTKHAAATALTGTISSCDIRSFNERLVMTFSGINNTPKFWDPNGGTTTWEDLPGTPPDAEFMQIHLGRLWMNDKTNRDRLHYSATFDQTKWGGSSDSGAIDVAVGDGDSAGISAIFPPFKDVLPVAKGTAIWQISNDLPETFAIQPISRGIGALSHKAVAAIDMDDVYYMSRRGFHSLLATANQGDFESTFLSKKVQPDFIDWNQGRAKYVQAAFVSSLNSVVYTISEDGDTAHTSLWLYNIEFQEWYRWPSINAQAIGTQLDSNSKVRLMVGLNNGRIALAQNGVYNDYSTNSVSYRIKSGTIYPDNNAQTIKAFKKVSLLFKPRGNYSFTVYFKVDNYPSQAFTFEQDAGGSTLGGTFTLGSSALGRSSVFAPFTKSVVGYGRGCSIEVFQTGSESQVEIYGYIIEYEPADIADEVR